MGSSRVIAREAELGSIDAFLAQIPQGPTAFVLAGDTGIGKTILWQVGVDLAEERSLRVLRCRGVEAEASLSFVALSELLAPVLAESLEALAPPRRRALEVALLLAEPGETVPDAHVVGLAVLDVLRVVAVGAPLLIAIDDAQWLDAASVSVLQIALRRLRDEPIGLLLTVRESLHESIVVELERGFPEGRLHLTEVGPLSLSALHHLLQERLSLELSRSELLVVEEATLGNPFFALEVGRELALHGKHAASGEPLPVPSSLRQLLGRRLDRLSSPTRDVLLIAALARRPTIDVIARTRGDHAQVVAALGEAVDAGVGDLSDGQRFHFAHPLFASVLYERAPFEVRRQVHRVLATTATDVEERVRHLARAADGPDPESALEMAAAAEHAAGRGAPAVAAQLCELAAQFTPGDPPLARQRQLRAAVLLRLAGDRRRAVAILEELRTEVPPGLERSDVLYELATTRRTDSAGMARLCDDALADARGDNTRSARLLSVRGFAYLFGGHVAQALSSGREALARAEEADDPTLVAVAIACVGRAELYGGDADLALLERGARIEERLGLALEYDESPGVVLARVLMRLGRIDAAREILTDVRARADARGDESTRAWVLASLSLCEWLLGRWRVALDNAVEAHEFMEQTNDVHGRGVTGRYRALIETDLGLVQRARLSVEDGLAAAREMSDGYFAILDTGILGRLELALGNLEAAGAYLRDLPANLASLGVNDPVATVWADTIETLAALGEADLARAYLEQYERNARRLRSPEATAGAARCRSLLAAAAGDLDGAVAAAHGALDELDGYTYPFERARILLALGAALRSSHQKASARTTLEQALSIFDELGARLWAEKARSELGRISGRRPATPDDLTDAERDVARLAGSGLSNKQIAASLHMAVSTVEAHLSRVYRKLDLHRAELATRLAEMDADALRPRAPTPHSP